MSYKREEHYAAPSCDKCNDTGVRRYHDSGPEPCECMYDDHYCPNCGREVARADYFCDEHTGGCGWESDNYQPTESELNTWYDLNGTSEAERVERLYNERV